MYILYFKIFTLVSELSDLLLDFSYSDIFYQNIQERPNFWYGIQNNNGEGNSSLRARQTFSNLKTLTPSPPPP